MFTIIVANILLQEGVVIIDSPGLGESDEMDSVLMRYLPNAFAFIYVIDVSHAGGVQEDLKKKVKILKYNVALFILTHGTVLFSIVDHIYCM